MGSNYGQGLHTRYHVMARMSTQVRQETGCQNIALPIALQSHGEQVRGQASGKDREHDMRETRW
jgi:hypothetical protein